ncbi:MAG: pseudouridine-5'-phosphate glycosidase [Chloroflexota bacterium]
MSIPIVALESTVISHGLPRPHNLSLARDMEQEVRSEGACPATIAVLDGQIHIGLTDNDLERVANLGSGNLSGIPLNDQGQFSVISTGSPGNQDSLQGMKLSCRDLATAITKKASGGTTVAGTMFIANQIGIKVLATGGIGGVHASGSFDISADLTTLADTPMIVVCAGAKAFLDLQATIEYLETSSVPVVGYQTDDFPAFYSATSGLKASLRLNSPEEIVEFARNHWSLSAQSSILVTQPPPAMTALPRKDVERNILLLEVEAREKGIKGQAVTPYFLSRLNELTQGAALRTNLSLLINNARLGAQISRAWNNTVRTKVA